MNKLDWLLAELATLLATAERGKVLREGVRTVIYGAPNVGKSSLLNLLLGHERAIVSPQPGTTRDVIEETVNLHGLPLRLIDTAGLRETVDELEQAGIARTRRQLERADLTLHVFDASEPLAATDAEAMKDDIRTLSVLNKVDLGEHSSWAGIEAVRLSCLTGTGIEALSGAIAHRLNGGTAAQRDWSLAINTRHEACLQAAARFTEEARSALRDGMSAEFIAEELRGALDAIGEVIGKTDYEEILGKIFSTFCIGK